jgi:hypothetical protein
LGGVPDYFVFDKDKKGQYGAETLLYDVISMIESKQRDASELALKGTKK